MPRCSLLAVLVLSASLASSAQTITCSNWQFFRAPSPWINFGASGINRWGTVVGGVSQSLSTITHGFVRWSNGSFDFYRVPHSIQTSFLHRSKLGVSVGYYTDSSYITHGLVVSGTNYVTVDYPGEMITELTSINKWGTIIGFHQAPGQGTFKLKNGVFKKISYPGSTVTWAENINDNGVIVGGYGDPVTGSSRGFILQNGIYTTLDNPKADPETGTQLRDINNSGATVGWYYAGPIGHSFIYKNGIFADIDPPNSNYTLVSGINTFGDVTGTTNLPSGFSMFTAHCQ